MYVLVGAMAQLGQTVSMYQNLNPTNTNINEVAFSGSYTDLANTPVISTVGHSGQYSDVLNPPTRVSQFANDANYAVIGQKVSEFVNDANYAVIGQKVSEFANDAQYTVNGSNISQFANNSNYAVRGENVSEFANNANYAVRGENVSEFANNANYAVVGQNVSEFNNTAGYITSAQVPKAASAFIVTWTAGSIAAGGQGSQNITFPTSYSYNPAMIASVSGTSRCGVEATPTSGSGGYVTLYNLSTGTAYPASVSVLTS